MNIIFASLLSTIALCNLASAWDCDKRCPGYEECVAQNGGRNLKQQDPSFLEDLAFLAGETKAPREQQTIVQQEQPTSNLRGTAFKEDDNTSHRQLVMSNYTHFHLKMYWEEGYCVSIKHTHTHVCQ